MHYIFLWLATLAALNISQSIFIDREQASTFLRRVTRSNRGSVFEEIRPGNRERECVEEACSYEEALEISDNPVTAQKFWIRHAECRNIVSAPGSRRRRQLTNAKKDLFRRCLDDINQCISNPCVASNSAACQDLFDDYKCICKYGFSGKRCEIDNDDCKPNPCDATGTDRCIDLINSFRCDCKIGFIGDRCGTIADRCTPNPCNKDGTDHCVDNGKRYVCECRPGFTDRHCATDINECLSNPCGDHGSCSNEVNSFRCLCDDLYFGTLCEQVVDDCRSQGCSSHGKCKENNESGEYFCLCSEGYTGSNCETDIDECSSSPCDQECLNSPGSYTCSCQIGFIINLPDVSSCVDIDECQVQGTGCEHECSNSPGSYSCTCELGYELDNLFQRYCNDIDECKQDNGGCAGKCLNNEGSFYCTCSKGYETSDEGRTCLDINECDGYHGCQYICTNTPGSHNCSCPDGYGINYDKRTCRDVNECALSEPPCEQKCTNSPGSFLCSCNKGFTLSTDGKTCSDTDECSEENGQCSHRCTNTIGSYKCLCDSGYELIGRRCFNINECRSNPCLNGRCNDGINAFTCSCFYGYSGILCESSGDSCSSDPCQNGDCQPVADSYSCTCNSGYTGTTCSTDINECDSNNGGCPGDCENTEGSYICACSVGFSSSGQACVDINECENANLCEHDCVNTDGSYQCTCREGFVISESGTECVEQDACASGADCDHICTNTLESYKCSCRRGYRLQDDAISCSDVDECADGSASVCEQECRNTIGSFNCSCRHGYRLLDDGTRCATTTNDAASIIACLGNKNESIVTGEHLLVGAKSNDVISKRATSALKKKMYFSFRLRTFATEGVVMALTNPKSRWYLYVVLKAGNLHCEFNLGSGHKAPKIANVVYVADGAWHEINLRKAPNYVKLTIDGDRKFRSSLSRSSRFISGSFVHIGGLPVNHTLAQIVSINPYFEGCFNSVQVKGGKLVWTQSKRALFNEHSGCFSDIDSTGSFFFGTGYVKLDPSQYRASRDLTLRVVIRTSYPDGLLISGVTEEGGTYKLSLENGQLLAIVANSNGATIQSAEYRNKDQLMCNGLWMTVYCKMSRGTIQLYVNGMKAQTVRNGRRVSFASRMPLFIGGLTGSDSPRFHGSMRRLDVNGQIIILSDSSDYKGVTTRSMPAQ